ncbi:MAG: acyltransferase [Novosphingobium sp.]
MVDLFKVIIRVRPHAVGKNALPIDIALCPSWFVRAATGTHLQQDAIATKAMLMARYSGKSKKSALIHLSQKNITQSRNIPLLDFWRSLSITLVILGHLAPLGPRDWEMNGAFAATGMVMFFTLSGFLITRGLLHDGDVRRFLTVRLLRIAPLAWLGIALAAAISATPWLTMMMNAIFLANIPPFWLLPAGAHFWSLCLEMQFYVGIAILVLIGRQRALLLLPVACLAITALRIAANEPISIVSWFRCDEILAGATLALVHEGRLGVRLQRIVACPALMWLLPAVLLSAHPASGAFMYLRPHLSALMIGASIYSAPQWLHTLSRWWPVGYVARTSYALYVFHGLLDHTWLGMGDTVEKYAKRPLLLGVTWALSHLSTFYYEARFNALARRLTRHRPDHLRPDTRLPAAVETSGKVPHRSQ